MIWFIIQAIVKIIIGGVLILLSLNWLIDYSLKKAQDPYEWEKEMKEMFCNDKDVQKSEVSKQ